MAMDIEAFVEDPGRQELVGQVRAKIDELGIDYLYLQFVSVTGRIMGKGIPADHWESVAERIKLVYGAHETFPQRRGEYRGYGGSEQHRRITEPENFMRSPGQAVRAGGAFFRTARSKDPAF